MCSFLQRMLSTLIDQCAKVKNTAIIAEALQAAASHCSWWETSPARVWQVVSHAVRGLVVNCAFPQALQLLQECMLPSQAPPHAVSPSTPSANTSGEDATSPSGCAALLQLGVTVDTSAGCVCPNTACQFRLRSRHVMRGLTRYNVARPPVALLEAWWHDVCVVLFVLFAAAAIQTSTAQPVPSVANALWLDFKSPRRPLLTTCCGQAQQRHTGASICRSRRCRRRYSDTHLSWL